MNEKIRRFMEQAVISIDGQTFGKTYIPDEFTEKFAELIVKECADFADEHNDYAEGVTLGVGKAIKQYFGVEE
jgi:hypothetical protein